MSTNTTPIDDDAADAAFEAWRQSMWDVANAVVETDRLHREHGGDRASMPTKVRQALDRLDKTPNPYADD